MRGRAIGSTAVARFRDLSGERLARAESEQRNSVLSAELETTRAMLASAPLPVWLRDESGALVWTDPVEWYWGLMRWLRLLGETLLMAYVGTALGAIGAFFLCFLAAANVSPRPWLRLLVRRFCELCRRGDPKEVDRDDVDAIALQGVERGIANTRLTCSSRP